MTRKLLTCSSLSRLQIANFYNMDKISWESLMIIDICALFYDALLKMYFCF